MTEGIGLVVGSYIEEAAPNLVRVVCKAHVRTVLGDDGGVRRQLCEELDCAAVDAVTFGCGVDMWLDDAAMYTKPVNYAATYLAKAHGLWQPESFHGTAVFLGRGSSGESIGLTDKQLADLRNQIDRSLTDGPPEP